MARDGDLVVDPFPALLSLEKTGALQVAVSVWDLAEASPESPTVTGHDHRIDRPSQQGGCCNEGAVHRPARRSPQRDRTGPRGELLPDSRSIGGLLSSPGPPWLGAAGDEEVPP